MCTYNSTRVDEGKKTLNYSPRSERRHVPKRGGGMRTHYCCVTAGREGESSARIINGMNKKKHTHTHEAHQSAIVLSSMLSSLSSSFLNYTSPTNLVDVGDRLGDALAHVQASPIAQLDRLVHAGRRARRHRRAEQSLLGGHVHLAINDAAT